ncbi:MAG: DegT/DnrJ/EryC1/StrS family aminotransferase [Sandaracinaceae bacterium]
MSQLAILGGAPTLTQGDHRPWPQLGAREREAVSRVLERGVLGGEDGPASRALEARFAELVGVRHALLTHAGTSALQLALAAAEIAPGEEVILPAYGYVAAPLCVLARGGPALRRRRPRERQPGSARGGGGADAARARDRADALR